MKVSTKEILIRFAKNKAKEMIMKPEYSTKIEKNEKKEKEKKKCRGAR